MSKIYCVVNEDNHYLGNKEEIISEVCDYRIENRCLFYKFKGFMECKGHSYSEEWSNDEIHADVIKHLFSMLCRPQYRLGYTIFESTSWELEHEYFMV